MASTQIEITKDIAAKVLATVDAGLVKGVGQPVPGSMCVEAAVCYALGQHGDEPSCVARTLRSLKIQLNDSAWSSNEARAKGLRRLALAQLGSADYLDEREFVRRVVDFALRVSTPQALRSAASIHKDEKHKAALIEAANRCEKEATRRAALDATKIAADADAVAAYAAADAAADAAYDAYAHADAAAAAAAVAAYAAAAAADADAKNKKSARDKSLADFAEVVVQILIDMKAPGCQWLVLTEAA
jgi:hypothetical protein